MSNIAQDKKQFRSIVLGLKKLNPSWQAPDISTFLQESENPPLLKRHAPIKRVNRTLKRGTVEDKQRSGRPTTIVTSTFQQQVKRSMRLTKGASIRNVTSALNRQGVKCCATTVRNTAHKLKLKWYKTKKSQKLTVNNKIRRVECTKRLLLKYGIRKQAKKWKWDRIVNTDFSGKFTLEPFQNRRNDGIWAEEGEEIPSSLINAPTEKFQKGIIFWGAISSQGLIPATAPINLTEWLRQQPSNGKGPRMYLTGELYGKFVAEKVAPAIQRAFENTHLQPIFQDDQDSKQRTSFAMTTIESFFDERISPEDDDAKFADVWPIERVWGAIKEKIRGKQFKNEAQRKKEIVKQWKNFTAIKCKEMIKKIPNRLRQIIDQDGEQIHDH
ncbi:unnamed protein product [Rotaria sp. Silwood1]|nr:unnamed protein product [Rotaria sp. Silwood1]CAF1136773.1 unnamed protein product [Rotaria sp. Silwood1]